MITIEEIENYLDIYSAGEIFEHNGVTDADVLLFLVNEGFLELPDIRPL